MTPIELRPPEAPAMRVFLVEDSPLVIERLQAMLAGIDGMQAVGVASTAQGAIDGIRSVRPDVVVVDLRLAEGSGLDVVRALRAQCAEDPAREAIAIYMLSNFTEAPYRRLAERLGVQGFFDKSTEFERVRDVLSAHAQSIRADRMH